MLKQFAGAAWRAGSSAGTVLQANASNAMAENQRGKKIPCSKRQGWEEESHCRADGQLTPDKIAK
jgi:hypothetical protein